MTGNEKDYTAVLLEDVNSNMKAFWEVISGTQGDVKILKEQVGIITERLDSVDSRLDSIDTRFDKVDSRLDSIEFKLDDLIKEISSIKMEMKSLKTSISTKADKEKFETLELRIIRIEKHLELSTTS